MTDTHPKMDLETLPGHFARRLHQTAVALFAQEVAELGLTPVQYSSLQTICDQSGIDQKTLAQTIGYDTSTIAGVIDRLETRGLVTRQVAPNDRRARQLFATPAGTQLLAAVVPKMLKSQQRLLQPLKPAERQELMRLMKIVIDDYADLSHIPAKG